MSDAPDPTLVVPATAAAGLSHELSGLGGLDGDGARAWFDERLHAFMAALSHDAAGRSRTGLERRALATAAREMVARIGWADAEHGPGASLGSDQVLANTYQVRGLIARGGIGEVYRARHRDLRTDHAIKILLPQHTLDMMHVTMLLNEARLLSAIRHDGVVAFQGLLRDADQRLMLVMEHVRGRTLADRIAEGPMPLSELLALTAGLAGALGAAHAANVVHTDVSPGNIILRDDSAHAPVLIDFGLARSLHEPADTQLLVDFAGKYSWVSPEQLAGPDAPIDARSDVYSAGLVLAAAARGEKLPMGQDANTARAARAAVPDLDGVPAALRPLLARALDPDPAHRIPTAVDFTVEPSLGRSGGERSAWPFRDSWRRKADR